jgi:alkylation response protein AidB-like acyl-CoA dehydrogenase
VTNNIDALVSDGALRFRAEVREWLSANLPETWVNYASDSHKALGSSPYDGLTEGSWKIGSGQVHKGWDELQASAGYFCPTWPCEYGGRGLSEIEQFILSDEYASAHAPDGFEVQGRYDVGPLLLAAGTPEQKRRYLPSIVAAQAIWCGGLSEPSAGSDLASLQTRARRVPGGFRITGEKIWTGFAAIADYCLLLTRSSDGPRYRNLTYLMVDMRQPEIEVTPLLQMTGTYGFNHVRFSGAFANDEDVVGDVDAGWQVAVGALGRERGVESALRRLVVLRETADQLASCARSHEDSRPPGDQTDSLLAELEIFRAHLARIAVSSGDEQARGAAPLHIMWSELWQRLCRAGLRTRCTEHEYFWTMRYMQSRPATIYGGTTQIQRNVVSERTLRLPR